MPYFTKRRFSQFKSRAKRRGISCVLTYEQFLSNHMFCNVSCSAKYNNVERGDRSDTTRENISNGVRKHLENIGWFPHTKIFLNECEMCYKLFYWKRKKKSCSEKCKRNLISKKNLENENTGFAHSRKIQYGEYILGSPYELKFAELLDELNVSWIRPPHVKYNLDGKTRKYYPDFLLENDVYIDTKNDYLQIKDQPKLFASANQNNIVLLVFGLKGITKENILKIMKSDFSEVKLANQYWP